MTTESVIIAVLGSVGALLMGLLSAGIIALVRATLKNTQEMAVLNSKIEKIVENDGKIPKMLQDLNNFYERLKILEKKVED